MLWGREVTGAPPSGSETSKAIRKQKPKFALDLEKKKKNHRERRASGLMVTGIQPGLCKSKDMSRKCIGRRSHVRRNEARCSEVKRSNRAGKDEALAAAAVREGSETTATSGTSAGGERAGALFVRWKTSMDARINGA